MLLGVSLLRKDVIDGRDRDTVALRKLSYRSALAVALPNFDVPRTNVVPHAFGYVNSIATHVFADSFKLGTR